MEKRENEEDNVKF